MEAAALLFISDLGNYLFPLSTLNILLLISGIPITKLILRKSKSKIMPTSALISLISISYLNFTLTSISSKFFPFNKTTSLIILGFWIALNLGINRFIQKEEKKFLQKSFYKKLLYNWILFLGLSILFYFLKSFQPEIYKIERTMSIGLINTLISSEKLPPPDFWMAGKAVNYYYFGHFMASLMIRLLNIKTTSGFFLIPIWMHTTLAITTYTFASRFFNAITQSKEPKKDSKSAGLISAYMVTLGGTLYSIKWFMQHIKNWISNGEQQFYWFAEAIRPNEFTFLDIPLYSFLFHELHAHTWGFLLGLLVLHLLLSLLQQEKDYTLIPIAFVLGITYMTNSWDTVTLGLLTGITFLLKKKGKMDFKTVLIISAVPICAYLVALPWSMSFSNPIKGLAIVNHSTPLILWLAYWGAPLSFLVTYFITRVRLEGKKISLTFKESECFLYAILLTSLLLITCVELINLRDVLVKFNNNRFNTFWKVSIQVWIWLTAIIGPILIKLNSNIKESSILKKGFSCLLIIIFLAVNFYTGKTIYQGIIMDRKYSGITSGLQFWENINPDEYELFKLFQKMKKLNPIKYNTRVIAESTGPSYSSRNFLAPFLGWQTVLGWDNHENTWRGSSTESERRYNDLVELYIGESQEKSRQIIRKYGIDYIIISKNERETFKNDLKENKLRNLGKSWKINSIEVIETSTLF